MQNKGKITAIALAVAVIVVGGGLFVAKKNIEAREQQIARGFERVEKLLPPNVKQENLLVKGLFSSTGVYKINYTEKNKTDSLVVDYKLEHGLGAWFGGDIKFHSTVKMVGESFNDITITDPQWMVMDGDIKNDGSFDMKGVGAKAVAVSTGEDKVTNKVIIDPSNLSITYNKPTGAVKADLVYPAISVTGKDTGTIKNVKLATNFNINQPDLGDFSLKIDEIKDKAAEIKGVDIYGKAELVKDKLDVTTSFKVANLSIIPLAQKDVQLELTYSLKGIDKIALQLYREMYEQASKEKEFTPEMKTKFVEGMKQILKTGMVLGLDKLSIKNPKGLVDFSGAIEMKPSATVQDISFEKNTKLKFDLLVSGEFAQMATAMAPPEQSQFIILDEKNNIKMSLVFDNGVFNCNS
jgi:Bacterial protein of unknown function (DUF945)